ncbi:MAG TPA: hypothetical protein VK835_11725 [Bacteroidia bacterium]|jgi:hypothetical protein|nr:hypothetical protein [Bacteroidia bacterium]
MKKFKDLIIKSKNNNDLKLFLQTVITQLPKNWKFREDLTIDYAKNVAKDKSEVGCFESPKIGDKTALVWFVLWDNELKIVNIIPSESGSLTHDEYNKILNTFNEDCIIPIKKDASLDTEITSDSLNINQIAGEKTFEALNKWEALCNHSTGNINAYDADRWYSFICISHQERSGLTPELLERWLVEEKNWKDDDLTTKMMLDYEYGLALLDCYVKNK